MTSGRLLGIAVVLYCFVFSSLSLNLPAIAAALLIILGYVVMMYWKVKENELEREIREKIKRENEPQIIKPIFPMT